MMSADFVTHPAVATAALLASASLAALGVGAAAWFETQRARLNPATRFEDLGARIQLRREELQRLDEQALVKQRELDDRDRKVAEIAALQAMLDALKLEYAGLEEARRQIEEVKHDAAKASETYAEAKGEVERMQKELDALEMRKAELIALLAQADELTAKTDQLTKEKRRLDEGAQEAAKALEALREEVAALRAERASVHAAIVEAATLTAEGERLRIERDRADTERNVAYTAAQEARDKLELAKDHLAVEQLRLSQAEAHRERLDGEVRYLEARKAALDPSSGVSGSAPQFTAEVLNDLKLSPAPLRGVANAALRDESEADALNAVTQHLRNLNLDYSMRTVFAFHTALKINDYSQLTVLSGVSGTGKSLLPRRYAQAMGISFLSIAVEPRWDSPQDLLGFYNYIERKYRATDLARALVHMDPYNTSGLSDGEAADRMILVLLDEMNLARVEYYFSEFLSRLEARPTFDGAQDAKARQDAEIPVDIRGRPEGPIKLFPSHNVLFVGTMNDDESTQALSDKVLDRSNILQFAKPDHFQTDLRASAAPPRNGYLRLARWRAWIKPIGALNNSDREWIGDRIKKLSNIMENCGRPFGHRLNTAIFAYCANYPVVAGQADAVGKALADQIEFRILPKLRGLQIEDHAAQFDDLHDLIASDLNDAAFAERLEKCRVQQRGSSGLFNWRGLTR